MTNNHPPAFLRRFGLTMAVAFGLIGALLWWKDLGAWPYVAGLAGFFLVTGLLIPKALAPVEWAWMKVALVLSAIMTRVILTIAYLLIMIPFSFLLRAMGKELLAKRPDPEATTYWSPVEVDGPATRPEKPY